MNTISILLGMLAQRLQKLGDWLDNPPRWWEPTVWVAIVLIVAFPRVLMFLAVPTALWSDDAGSYVDPAVGIVHGNWQIESRRGLGYIIYILPFTLFPEIFLPLVGIAQQATMGGVIVGALIFLRLIIGQGALVWLLLISWGASFYAVPLFVAHLIRNETPHAFFTMLGFGFLGLALKRKSALFAGLSGISLALMNLVKGTLPLAPFFAAPALWYVARKDKKPWRPTATLLASYLVVKFLPAVASLLPGVEFETTSYAAQELYSQVAHLALIDSKKYPEITQQIRPQIEAYLAMGKRDNSHVRKEIIRRISTIIASNSEAYPPLDHVCRDLAFDIIITHPIAFLKDAWEKFWELNLETGYQTRRPHLSHIRNAGRLSLESSRETNRFGKINFTPGIALQNASETPPFVVLKKLSARVFPWENTPPVLMTTVLSLVLPFVLRGALRQWCIQITLSWFFFLILHATVGEPKDRFYVPVFCLSIFLLGITAVKLAELSGRLLRGLTQINIPRNNSPSA